MLICLSTYLYTYFTKCLLTCVLTCSSTTYLSYSPSYRNKPFLSLIPSFSLLPSLVVWTLWGAKQPGEQHSAATRHMVTRAKKRVVKMVAVVLIVFVICWTPLQTLMLYSNFSQDDFVSF